MNAVSDTHFTVLGPADGSERLVLLDQPSQGILVELFEHDGSLQLKLKLTPPPENGESLVIATHVELDAAQRASLRQLLDDPHADCAEFGSMFTLMRRGADLVIIHRTFAHHTTSIDCDANAAWREAMLALLARH